MNPVEILAFVDKLLTLIPLVIQAGGDVVETITNGRVALAAMQAGNRGPTDQEWADLNSKIDGLMAQLKDGQA